MNKTRKPILDIKLLALALAMICLIAPAQIGILPPMNLGIVTVISGASGTSTTPQTNNLFGWWLVTNVYSDYSSTGDALFPTNTPVFKTLTFSDAVGTYTVTAWSTAKSSSMSSATASLPWTSTLTNVTVTWWSTNISTADSSFATSLFTPSGGGADLALYDSTFLMGQSSGATISPLPPVGWHLWTMESSNSANTSLLYCDLTNLSSYSGHSSRIGVDLDLIVLLGMDKNNSFYGSSNCDFRIFTNALPLRASSGVSIGQIYSNGPCTNLNSANAPTY